MEVLVRRAQYLRLAAAHAGPLGPALLGHPGLAPLYEKTYATCSGAPGLPCEGVGREPRVCLVRRLERLAQSALRGGKRRREQEKALVEGLLHCVAHLKDQFPLEFAPVPRPPGPSWKKTSSASGGRPPRRSSSRLPAKAGGTCGPG